MAFKIIGLTGSAGCGKNTVADILFRYGFTNFGFADPVYRALAAILMVSPDSLRDRSTKEKTIESLGKSPRELLQTLGTEWGRDTINQDIWVNIAMAQVQKIAAYRKGEGGVVLTDVRFVNEAEAIRLAGGAIWRIVRPSACLEHGAAQHSSESGIPEPLVDRVIANTGTIDDLEATVMTHAREAGLIK